MTYGWSTPADWTPNQLVDEDDMNAQVCDNIGYLYQELPIRATLWHIDSIAVAGDTVTHTVLTTQPHNYVAHQTTAADANSITQSFVLGEGTYTLYLLGQTTTTSGKVDWSIDGTSIATGQDWYSGSNTSNVTKSVASVVIATSGRHVLTGTINGKNASSSSYALRLTKLWFVPAADS